MATEAQNNANRENAKRSTGPNTAGGKETSSRNAVRHGILAAVIPAETPGFQETLLGLYASLNPMDEPQRLLVDQIAISMVRLQRVLAAEQQFLEAEATKASGDNRKSAGITAYLLSETASLSLRYEAMLNRLIQRNLSLIREMKAEWDWKLARKGDTPYIDREREEQPAAATEEEPLDASSEQPDPELAWHEQDSLDADQLPLVEEILGSELASFRKSGDPRTKASNTRIHSAITRIHRALPDTDTT